MIDHIEVRSLASHKNDQNESGPLLLALPRLASVAEAVSICSTLAISCWRLRQLATLWCCLGSDIITIEVFPFRSHKANSLNY